MPKPTASWLGRERGRQVGVGRSASGDGRLGASVARRRSASRPGAGRWPLVGTATRSRVGSSVGCIVGLRSSAPASGGERDRLDDLGVAGAAAQVAGDRLADRVLVRPAAGVEVGPRRPSASRRADPALGAAGLEERRPGAASSERLVRAARPGPRPSRTSRPSTWQIGHEAGVDDRAVEQHRARAALALAAALLRAGQRRGPRAGRRAGGACPGTSTSTGAPLTVNR